jgi:phosphatidylglycerol:prolipoprotein diacylglycerol transferase
MKSLLFRIGPVPIYSYGVMLMLAFLAGISLARRRARKYGLSEKFVLDLSIVILISSIVGARLMYVALHLQEFRHNPLEVINILHGIAGLSAYGGLLVAILATVLYTRGKRQRFGVVADTLAPPVALGIFITRVGCFLNGCCFGLPGDAPWCMTFSYQTVAGATLPGVRIHPTQLYMSLYGLIILVILLLTAKKLARPGALFCLFLLLYGASRFAVDFLRYYDPGNILGHMWGVRITVHQALSVAVVIAAAACLVRRGARVREHQPPVEGSP